MQQYRAVQTEAADRAPALRAAGSCKVRSTGPTDLAGRRQGRPQPPATSDHLGEVWAVPLAESRLSTFLAADRTASNDEGPEAFLSGSIVDLQARCNLRAVLGARRSILSSAKPWNGSASRPSSPPPWLAWIIERMRQLRRTTRGCLRGVQPLANRATAASSQPRSTSSAGSASHGRH